MNIHHRTYLILISTIPVQSKIDAGLLSDALNNDLFSSLARRYEMLPRSEPPVHHINSIDHAWTSIRSNLSSAQYWIRLLILSLLYPQENMVSVSLLSRTSSGGSAKRMSNMKVMPSCQVSHWQRSNGSASREEIISVFPILLMMRISSAHLSLILDDTGYTSLISEKENISHSRSSDQRKVSRRREESFEFEHICFQSLFSRDEN